MSSIGIPHVETAEAPAPRRLSRGLGLTVAALASLGLWAGLIHLALLVLGAA